MNIPADSGEKLSSLVLLVARRIDINIIKHSSQTPIVYRH